MLTGQELYERLEQIETELMIAEFRAEELENERNRLVARLAEHQADWERQEDERHRSRIEGFMMATFPDMDD